MNRSRITGAILLRWDDCTSILSKHLTTLLQRPIQLCHMVEDYDYWCVASINGRFSIPELHSLLDALSATTVDFPDLIPEESNQTRSFSMEFSRALLQHYLHASWRYEHLTEEYLMVPSFRLLHIFNYYIKRMPALQADGYLFAWHLVLPSRTFLLQQAHGFLHFYGLVFFC